MDATGFDKLALVRDAANAVCETNKSRKTFKTYASELANMFKYVNREEMDDLTLRKKNAITAISGELNKKIKHADNTDLMVELNKIVNDYVQVVSSDENKPAKQFDISKIDFDLLRKEFAKTKTPRLALNDLEELVKQKIEQKRECQFCGIPSPINISISILKHAGIRSINSSLWRCVVH